MLVEYEHGIQLQSMHCGKCLQSDGPLLEIPSGYSVVHSIQSDTVNGCRLCNICFMSATSGDCTWRSILTMHTYNELKICQVTSIEHDNARNYHAKKPLLSVPSVSSVRCVWKSVPLTVNGRDVTSVGEVGTCDPSRYVRNSFLTRIIYVTASLYVHCCCYYCGGTRTLC